jgi:hypothetical protein
MKTLANPRNKAEIVTRVQAIQPSSTRHWGRMSVDQMICHLCDSFRGVMGEKVLSPAPRSFASGFVKWFALNVPLRWPHGVQTRPEMDQLIGGTKPADFERDRDNLLLLLDRFTMKNRDFRWQPHPMFGELTDDEWMRWGYVHMDHHLRQFGA